MYIIIAMLIFLCSCTHQNTIKPFSFIEVSNGIIVQDDTIILPEPNSMLELNIIFDQELPASKDEGGVDVVFELKINGALLKAYGNIKVQGSSTAYWLKKNWSLSFYSDEERTNELKLKIGDSIASSKWITKADWIDPTQLRNALSYGLWESMIQSRTTFPQYEVDNAWINEQNMISGTPTGAQGFPKTYISQVKVNNEHYGISLFLLGHDADNFNIDKSNPKHMYLDFDARGGDDLTKTWEKFSYLGIGTWVNSYHPNINDLTELEKTAIENLGKLINSSLDEFEKNFDIHLDKTNMIDMLLLIEVIFDNDAIAQDIEIVTYNLEKWFFLPWDKDTTFGMSWDESGILKNSESNLVINYQEESSDQKPWYKTYHAFTDEVEERYAQLRDEGVFSVLNLSKMAADINNKISQAVWDAERERWPNRPSMDETSTAQILSWFEKRLELLDNHFNYKSKK